jgi:hypothetical protein
VSISKNRVLEGPQSEQKQEEEEEEEEETPTLNPKPLRRMPDSPIHLN